MKALLIPVLLLLCTSAQAIIGESIAQTDKGLGAPEKIESPIPEIRHAHYKVGTLLIEIFFVDGTSGQESFRPVTQDQAEAIMAMQKKGAFQRGVPPTPAGLRHVNYSNGKGIHGWYSPEVKLLILSDSRSEAYGERLKAARAKK